MAERTITIRGVRDATLDFFRKAAVRNRRSLNAELLTVLEASARPEPGVTLREPGVPPGKRTSTIPPVDRDKLASICRRFHIRSLALFGSAARGQAGPGSDVDLLAEFESGMTPGFGIVTLTEELGRVFGRPVDLVTLRGLTPGFRERITLEKVPLYHA